MTNDRKHLHEMDRNSDIQEKVQCVRRSARNQINHPGIEFAAGFAGNILGPDGRTVHDPRCGLQARTSGGNAAAALCKIGFGAIATLKQQYPRSARSPS
jgi:hypothetical protein